MTMDTNRSAMKIEWEELFSPETESQVQDMIAARSVPLVREVGAAAEAKPVWYRGQLAQMSLAGLLGGLLAWGLTEFILLAFPDMEVTASNILFTMVLGFGIGLIVALWEGVVTRSWAKAKIALIRTGPALAGLTLIGGVIADRIYQPWIENVYQNTIAQAYALDWTEAQFSDAITSALHLPRGVAWAIVGLVAGLAIGIGSRNRQKVINGALGGFAGGLLGGFMFDFFNSGPPARAFGIMIMGLAIGLGIALVERARREHWLEIVSGGMAGKQFILYGDSTTIGASPDNDVTLIKDPAIAPHHAVLKASSDSLELAAQSFEYTTLVNGAQFEKRTLVDGDVVQFGSTMLRYRNKSEQPVVAGAIVG